MKPIPLSFSNCLRDGVFPNDWKKANVIPVHKKRNKQLVSNYRPVSLLPISSKFFEKLFLDQNCLLNVNQSDFRPGDSCIHQLIPITHDIFTAFDANLSLKFHSIFLDLSTAFGRVCHKSLIHKVKSKRINDNLLSLIESLLHNRYQRVVLNGQFSKWQNVNAGVPQGPVLGSFFSTFILITFHKIYILMPKWFGDETLLFSVIHDLDDSSTTLNNDLGKIQEWTYNYKISFNSNRKKQAQEVIFRMCSSESLFYWSINRNICGP